MLDQEAMKRVEQLLNDETQSGERTRTHSEVTVAKKRDRSVVDRPALELLQSQGFVKDDGIITVSSAKAFLNRFGFKAPRARKATREDYVDLLLDIANAAPHCGWSVNGLKKYAGSRHTEEHGHSRTFVGLQGGSSLAIGIDPDFNVSEALAIGCTSTSQM